MHSGKGYGIGLYGSGLHGSELDEEAAQEENQEHQNPDPFSTLYPEPPQTLHCSGAGFGVYGPRTVVRGTGSGCTVQGYTFSVLTHCGGFGVD